MMAQNEFEEISHSGGKVEISIKVSSDGARQYQQSWTHCRPVASGLFSVWALPQGLVVGNCPIGGIGSSMHPPPVPGALMVIIGSDSEGRYGHECPACKGYWRSEGFPALCPYCAFRAPTFQFLTDAQHNYVEHYVDLLLQALNAPEQGSYIIDLDAVADAAGKDCEKPPFYYVEERQQKRFSCKACGRFNDVLGTYVYCSSCGTRNDYDELTAVIDSLRVRTREGVKLESLVKEAVSAFDSFCGQYMHQLLKIPMAPSRLERLRKMHFHDLNKSAEVFKQVFDINIFIGLSDSDIQFAKKMFHRRHVYEHKGGEVDEKYIMDSGDTSVRLKQALRENNESVHNLLNLVSQMGKNLHNGFHEIFPPVREPIDDYKKWNK